MKLGRPPLRAARGAAPARSATAAAAARSPSACACDRCGADLELRDVEAVFGPGARHHREGEPVDGRPAAA